MKRILVTTAIVALTALPLAAEQHKMNTKDVTYTTTEGMDLRISDLMGKTVYIPREGDNQTGITSDLTEAPDTWEDVADISDILIGADGQMSAVILDVGGFLGMGEKEMQVSLRDLMIIPDSDDEDAFFAIYTGTRQLIEDSEAYDETAAREDGYLAVSELVEETVADETTVMEVVRDLLNSDVTTAQLMGVRVFSSDDEWVGEIDELVLSAEGQIKYLIVDIGGFLGIGEKEVALNFGQVTLMQADDAGSITAHVSMTETDLESLKSWEGPAAD